MPPKLVWMAPFKNQWGQRISCPLLKHAGLTFPLLLALATALTIGVVFSMNVAHELHLLYLVFIPLFLISMLYGVRGATLGILYMSTR